MEHILIPVDGSETSMHAVEEGGKFAEKFGAKVTLLYVLAHPEGEMLTNSSGLLQNAIDQDKDEALAMLKDAKERFLKDLEKEVHLAVAVGPVPTVVREYIEGHGCDFMIMGSQGLGSALKRLLVGSVTKKILTMVDVPVLVVR